MKFTVFRLGVLDFIATYSMRQSMFWICFSFVSGQSINKQVLWQGLQKSRFKAEYRKLYGRTLSDMLQDNCYEAIFILISTSNCSDYPIDLSTRVLTPTRHLIRLLLYKNPRVCNCNAFNLIFSICLFIYFSFSNIKLGQGTKEIFF